VWWVWIIGYCRWLKAVRDAKSYLELSHRTFNMIAVPHRGATYISYTTWGQKPRFCSGFRRVGTLEVVDQQAGI